MPLRWNAAASLPGLDLQIGNVNQLTVPSPRSQKPILRLPLSLRQSRQAIRILKPIKESARKIAGANDSTNHLIIVHNKNSLNSQLASKIHHTQRQLQTLTPHLLSWCLRALGEILDQDLSRNFPW